jgi:hypothetical protein
MRKFVIGIGLVIGLIAVWCIISHAMDGGMGMHMGMDDIIPGTAGLSATSIYNPAGQYITNPAGQAIDLNN